MFEEQEENTEASLNKGKIIYNGLKLGLTKEEVMKTNPIEYLDLMDNYYKDERLKSNLIG